jgi:hypothetical protein
MGKSVEGAAPAAPFGSGLEQYEPYAIRQSLPVAYMVGRLLGDWDTGEDMSSCPLPGHADRTPSFNLWAPRDGVATRYGCFGCGQRGDVVDLIRMVLGVGFLEACRLAVDEFLPEYQASKWRPSPVSDRDGAPESVLRARFDTLMLETPQDMLALQAFGRRKGFTDRMLQYAHEEWQVQAKAGPPGVVSFPHFDVAGTLTGVKMRAGDRRFNVLGSRFTALYGAWRDRACRNVLFVEGETDAIYAAWRLRYNPEWDVLALPSGAAQLPLESHLGLLACHDTVVVCFDADEAGDAAVTRWIPALQDFGIHGRRIRLPDGEDVLSHGWAPT